MGTNIKLLQTDTLKKLDGIEQAENDYNYSSLANLGQRYGEKGSGLGVVSITGELIFKVLSNESNISNTYFSYSCGQSAENMVDLFLDEDKFSKFDVDLQNNIQISGVSFTNINKDILELSFDFEGNKYNITYNKQGKLYGNIVIPEATLMINSGEYFNNKYGSALDPNTFYLRYTNPGLSNPYQLDFNKDNSVNGWSLSDSSSDYEINEYINKFNLIYTTYLPYIIEQYNLNYADNLEYHLLYNIYNSVKNTLSEKYFTDIDNQDLNSIIIYIPTDYTFALGVSTNAEQLTNFVQEFINPVIVEFAPDTNDIPEELTSLLVKSQVIDTARFVKLSTTVNETEIDDYLLYNNVVDVNYVEPYISLRTNNWVVNNVDSGICAEGINGGQPNIVFLQTELKDSNVSAKIVSCQSGEEDYIINAIQNATWEEKNVNLSISYEGNNTKDMIYMVPKVDSTNTSGSTGSVNSDKNTNENTLFKNLLIVNISSYYKNGSEIEKISSDSISDENKKSYFRNQIVTFWVYSKNEWVTAEFNGHTLTMADLIDETQLLKYAIESINDNIDDKIENHQFKDIDFEGQTITPKQDTKITINFNFGFKKPLTLQFDWNFDISERGKFLDYTENNYICKYPTDSTDSNEIDISDEGNPLFSFNVPSIDLSNVILFNATLLNRINIMGLSNTTALNPYYAYYGLNPDKVENDVVTLGTSKYNKALDTTKLATDNFIKNQKQYKTLDINYDLLRNNNSSLFNNIFYTNKLYSEFKKTNDSTTKGAAFINNVIAIDYNDNDSAMIIEYAELFNKVKTLTGTVLSSKLIVCNNDIINNSSNSIFDTFTQGNEKGSGFISKLYSTIISTDDLTANNIETTTLATSSLSANQIVLTGENAKLTDENGKLSLTSNKLSIENVETTNVFTENADIEYGNINNTEIDVLHVKTAAQIDCELNVDFIAGGWAVNSIPVGDLTQTVYTKTLNPTGNTITINGKSYLTDAAISNYLFVHVIDDKDYLNINKLIDIYFPKSWKTNINNANIIYNNDIYGVGTTAQEVGNAYKKYALNGSSIITNTPLLKLNNTASSYINSTSSSYHSIAITVSVMGNYYYVKLTDIGSEDLTDIKNAITRNTTLIENLRIEHKTDIAYVIGLITQVKQVIFDLDADTTLLYDSKISTNTIITVTANVGDTPKFDTSKYTASKDGYTFNKWIINDVYELPSDNKVINFGDTYSSVKLTPSFTKDVISTVNVTCLSAPIGELVEMKEYSETIGKDDVTIKITDFPNEYAGYDFVKWEMVNESVLEKEASEVDKTVYTTFSVNYSPSDVSTSTTTSTTTTSTTTTSTTTLVPDTTTNLLNKVDLTKNDVIYYTTSNGKSLTENNNITASSFSSSLNVTDTYNSYGMLKASSNFTSIETQFAKNKNITEIIIPNTVTSLSAGAFKGCTNLKTIKFSDSMTIIPEMCCLYCSSIKNLVWPENLTRIEMGAFLYSNACSSKESGSDLPETLEYIGDYAFAKVRKEISNNLILNFGGPDGTTNNRTSMPTIEPNALYNTKTYRICYSFTVYNKIPREDESTYWESWGYLGDGVLQNFNTAVDDINGVQQYISVDYKESEYWNKYWDMLATGFLCVLCPFIIVPDNLYNEVKELSNTEGSWCYDLKDMDPYFYYGKVLDCDYYENKETRILQYIGYYVPENHFICKHSGAFTPLKNYLIIGDDLDF